ncbi:hypothetical protein [Bradyrhizobium sp. CCBAU 53421]|uniref:hypothetical protein n=1 Tax=Bradyrhizobium sp. CCBAU 53421 TaxID=1325120 RepID=UPI00188B4AA6|nr:hypothetical protein [Bradyrhizobium sp. CCBAU 53421]QOZ31800.1 hypothetical protein XH92_08880 [Bradyrhizobium sp. CCBAU 53421]
MALYAQTAGTLSTNSGTFTPIQGLSLTIPEGVGTTAIITLNVPNPYATGTDIPGGMFGVTINGKVSPVVASFTYNETPSSFGRIPTTLVVGIPLDNAAQTIQAVWGGVRGSTVIIDSPASLSAVI